MFDKYQELVAKDHAPIVTSVKIPATETAPERETVKMVYKTYDPDTGRASVDHAETMDADELKAWIVVLDARLKSAKELYQLATGKVA